MTSVKKKLTKEIQDYLYFLHHNNNLKHFLDMGSDVWVIQVSNDIMTCVEKYYKEKEK